MGKKGKIIKQQFKGKKNESYILPLFDGHIRLYTNTLICCNNKKTVKLLKEFSILLPI